MLSCQECGRTFRDWHALRTHQGQLVNFGRHHWLSREMLTRLYEGLGLSSREIASILGCPPDLVKITLRAHGLIRTKSEATALAYKKGLKKPWDGKEPPGWNGGIKHHRRGYRLVFLPSHHRANKDGYVLEHILVWEEANKRRLPDGGVIHHYNGIPSDNRPENLIAFPSSALHASFHNTIRLQKKNAEMRKGGDA